jgi:hypothetical protein
MPRLAVLVPSRGRPASLERLIRAVHDTARGDVDVLAGVDRDDPALQGYLALEATVMRPGDALHVAAERRNLVEWTNWLAIHHDGLYGYYASLGDDMVPRTPGWDVKLTGAIEEDFGGTGITYPWDGIRDDIPEAYIISADIPAALGWVMLPTLNHWYNDNVIADLGHGGRCIRQLRGVIVEHLNTGTGRAPVDQTAIDQGAKIPEDKAAYETWCRTGRLAAVEQVRKLRAAVRM